MTMSNNADANNAADIAAALSDLFAAPIEHHLLPARGYKAIATRAEPHEAKTGVQSFRLRFDLTDDPSNDGHAGCVFVHLRGNPSATIRTRELQLVDAAVGDGSNLGRRLCQIEVKHWTGHDGVDRAEVCEAEYLGRAGTPARRGNAAATADPDAVDIAALAEAHHNRQVDTAPTTTPAPRPKKGLSGFPAVRHFDAPDDDDDAEVPGFAAEVAAAVARPDTPIVIDGRVLGGTKGAA